MSSLIHLFGKAETRVYQRGGIGPFGQADSQYGDMDMDATGILFVVLLASVDFDVGVKEDSLIGDNFLDGPLTVRLRLGACPCFLPSNPLCTCVHIRVVHTVLVIGTPPRAVCVRPREGACH